MTKALYIFSGLGADERVFQRLDFSDYSPTFIKWAVPEIDESIESYATRLLSQINGPEPTLIGLSFGGLIAVEVAKQIATHKVILIASAKTKNEIPFYYRMAGKIGLPKFLPAKLLKRSNFLTNWFFGTETEFDRQLLKQILLETDSVFLKWAISRVACWSNRIQLQNIIHIHGTSDRILPFAFVKADVGIKGGGHLMTLNKADELTAVIRKLLLNPRN